MAKKKKKSTKSGKPAKKKSVLAEGIASEIIAVVLVVLALVILVGLVTDASGAASIVEVVRRLSGRGVYVVPSLLVFVSIGIFRSTTHTFSRLGLSGVLLALASLSGLFHMGAVGDFSWDIAREGGGGGLLGHIFGSIVFGILGNVAGAILLVGIFLIALMLSLNLRLSDIVEGLRRLFPHREKEEKMLEAPITIMQPLRTHAEPTLKSSIPLEHSQSSGMKEMLQRVRPSSQDPAKEALTVGADPDWSFPSLDLLDKSVDKADAGDWRKNAEIIRETLSDFKLNVEMGEINVGPRVTQYTLIPPNGVRLTKITSLDDNIALNLAAQSVRIEAPIPGKRAVGIEVPNKKSAMVRMRMLLDTPEWQGSASPLSFVVGQDIAGEPVVGALDKMPHLLIAGATNSGKSVMINALLTSLLYRNSPSDLKLILVDPKQVELGLYNDVPHLLSEVINEPEKCISALKLAVAEMERRLKTFAEVGKRNIAEYNGLKKEEGMPYIVIVIDELADLMMMAARDVESLVVRLAQKARATGIHLVLATQRPSVDVITGLIKANVPARIAFTVASQVDSRTILDGAGAEKLLGVGDMLFTIPGFTKPRRVQGAFISEREVKAVTDHLRMERKPDYNDEIISQPVQLGGKGSNVVDMTGADDELFREAVDLVVESGKASTSFLQRRMGLGYNRAARIIDLMEEKGIVGPGQGGARAREVLVSSADELVDDDSPV
jgi:S-DNA-T family DNA segregation ATPase FtsK/SpoIIIE